MAVFHLQLLKLWKLVILVIPLHADPTPSAPMVEYVLVYRNIKATPTPGADQSVYSTTIVRGTELASETSVQTHVQELAVRMQGATS